MSKYNGGSKNVKFGMALRGLKHTDLTQQCKAKLMRGCNIGEKPQICAFCPDKEGVPIGTMIDGVEVPP